MSDFKAKLNTFYPSGTKRTLNGDDDPSNKRVRWTEEDEMNEEVKSEDEEYSDVNEEEEDLAEYQVVTADTDSLSGDPMIIRVGGANVGAVKDPDDDFPGFVAPEDLVSSCPCNSACHRAILLSLSRLQRGLQANNRLLRRILGGERRFLASDSPVLPADFPVLLPIVEVGDLDVLETYLGEGAKFAETLPYFSSLGGNDAKKTFKRIMNTLVSYEAGRNLNWRGKGRRNKKAFETYTRIHNLIFHAVKQNPKALEVTLSDTEKNIKEWLRFAPDRYLRFVQGKGLLKPSKRPDDEAE